MKDIEFAQIREEIRTVLAEELHWRDAQNRLMSIIQEHDHREKKELYGRLLGQMNYLVDEEDPMMKIDRKRYNQGVENCRKVIQSFITPITNEDTPTET